MTGEKVPIDNFLPDWNPKQVDPQQELNNAVQALAGLCGE